MTDTEDNRMEVTSSIPRRLVMKSLAVESGLKILLLGKKDLVLPLSLAIEKHANSETTISLAESIDEYLENAGEDSVIDFVCIVFDTTDVIEANKVQETFARFGREYLASRLCVVNGTCRTGHYSEASNLVAECLSYDIPYFNMEIQNASTVKILCKQLVTFIETSTMGSSCKIPLPNISLV